MATWLRNTLKTQAAARRAWQELHQTYWVMTGSTASVADLAQSWCDWTCAAAEHQQLTRTELDVGVLADYMASHWDENVIFAQNALQIPDWKTMDDHMQDIAVKFMRAICKEFLRHLEDVVAVHLPASANNSDLEYNLKRQR